MEGGYLVTGVKDKTLEIVGTDISRLTFNGQPSNTQSATFKLTEQCTYLSSEGLSIEEFVTDDTHKTVWVIHIPKHLSRRPVLVHKKACQRIEDSLVELTQEKIISLRESSKLTAYGRYMIDNKPIENCVRPLAIGKKNYMFCGNHDAAEEAAIMYTMMGCCKLAGVDFRNG